VYVDVCQIIVPDIVQIWQEQAGLQKKCKKIAKFSILE
jgi:hypothetical protein